jgi:hypothetical protein
MNVKYMHDIRGLNTNNFQELAPFNIEFGKNNTLTLIKPRLVCDSLFYEEINDTVIMDILQNTYYIIKSNKKIRYGTNNTDKRIEKEYWNIYHILFNWMCIKNWSFLLEKPFNLIKLTELECSFLIKSTKDKEFMNKLDMIIESFEVKVFAKLDHGSSKRDIAPHATPISNADELFDQLVKNKYCISHLKTHKKEDNYLFITEWNKDIKKDNELRVFIDNSRISGVSQQYIYESYPFMETIIGKYPNMVLKSIQKLWNSIKNRIEYKTCILDVYIELNDTPFECHLIKINGCNRWGLVGSALFDWKTDDPLNGELELRIRC